MKRRELFQTMAGMLGAGAVAAASNVRMWSAGDQRFKIKHGLLTVDSHRAHKRMTGETLHVFFNGTDVTDSSYEANDVEGYVLVYCRDQEQHRDYTKHGHLHVRSDGGVCQFRLTGDVIIAPGPEL